MIAGSPVSAFRAALGTLPAAGEGALVLGKAGVGKSALLVHVGLGSLLGGEQVLHVSLRETVDHTRVHYDEILRALSGAPATRGGLAADAALLAERGRTILSLAAQPWDPALVERHLELLAGAAAFRPRLVIVDGFGSVEEITEAWPALLRIGREHGCAVWAGARGDGRCAVPEVTVVRLVPDGRIVRIVVDAEPHPVELAPVFDPTSLLVVGNEVSLADEPQVLPHGCTLYSGGAEGAETAFGEAAEQWGVHEVHFTFAGHLQARIRGRYVLSDRELATGDVSLSYVSRRLHRTYNDRGGLIRGVLQTLWHMVSRSQQVFVVGVVQEDGTVTGGTGWGVELARMWNRDLWVYDQERTAWFRWDGQGWAPGLPRITAAHICGTGTRYLNDHGRAAIESLFDRSFPQA